MKSNDFSLLVVVEDEVANLVLHINGMDKRMSKSVEGVINLQHGKRNNRED